MLALMVWMALPAPAEGADSPLIMTLQKPDKGMMEIIFHAEQGPFQIQMKTATSPNADPNTSWTNVPDAMVTRIDGDVYLGLFPKGEADLALYRVVNESDGIAELKGWTVLAKVSPPPNGLFFAPGDRPVVTVTILDTFAPGLKREAFSSLALYMYGPQDPEYTITPARLLNASTDRSARPHHYIDLITDPNVQVNGNTLTYTLQPVADELPGTYTVSVRAQLASDRMQQIMKATSVQIGTADVEDLVVTKTQCASCHQGSISGKFYMHHVDTSSRNPTGSWSLDYEPVTSCKNCHNNDGYAAFRDNSAPGGRVSDPIVRRVHGVHMGEHLEKSFNIDPETGDFADYTHVEFPANVRNCTTCHADDRWKTHPSILACGACHDNVWFGDKTELPAGMEAHPGGAVLPGSQSESLCATCHPADTGGAASITLAHKVPPPSFKNTVTLEASAPANGDFFVAGESPTVTIRIQDTATGAPIAPASIVEPADSQNVAATEWRRANFYVSGPRAWTEPVLTSAAAHSDPTHYYANNDLRVRIDPANEDSKITRTADAIVYQLDDVAGLKPGTYTAFVETMPAAPLGGWASINFQVGTATPEPVVAGNCNDCHGETQMHAGYFAVTFTPDICKNCHDYDRQTPDKIAWTDSNSGFGAAPLSRRIHGVHYGHYLDKPGEVHQQHDYSHTIFPQDVRNCTKCHSESTTWTEKPSRLACLACHDDDAAVFHGTLLTFDPSPQDPWNGDEVETCVVCHGKDSKFAPAVVHAISNPFVPPYPREKAE